MSRKNKIEITPEDVWVPVEEKPAVPIVPPNDELYVRLASQEKVIANLNAEIVELKSKLEMMTQRYQQLKSL